MTGLFGWSTRTIPQGLVHRTARTSAGGQTNGLVEFAGGIRGWRSGTSSLARAIHLTMAGHLKLGPLLRDDLPHWCALNVERRLAAVAAAILAAVKGGILPPGMRTMDPEVTGKARTIIRRAGFPALPQDG